MNLIGQLIETYENEHVPKLAKYRNYLKEIGNHISPSRIRYLNEIRNWHFQRNFVDI